MKLRDEIITYNAANLAEGRRDASRRRTYVVDKHLGNNSQLKRILLKFLGGRYSGRVEFEVEVLRCKHESLDNLLERSSQVTGPLPLRIDGEHLGCYAGSP